MFLNVSPFKKSSIESTQYLTLVSLEGTNQINEPSSTFGGIGRKPRPVSEKLSY